LLQYRGLFEHLNEKGVAKRPEKVVVKTRKKYALDEISSLRKKDAIIQSGGYERDKIIPPKGKRGSMFHSIQIWIIFTV